MPATTCLRLILVQEAGEAGLNSKPSYPTTAQPERKRPRPPSDSTPPRRSASRSRSRSRSRDRTFHHGDRHFPREDTRENNYGTIFVGNISHDTNENTLRDFFETYGRVASAKVRLRMDCLPHTDPDMRFLGTVCTRVCWSSTADADGGSAVYLSDLFDRPDLRKLRIEAA